MTADRFSHDETKDVETLAVRARFVESPWALTLPDTVKKNINKHMYITGNLYFLLASACTSPPRMSETINSTFFN